MAKRIAKTSLKFTGLYESELLVELMLRYWNHPNANDVDFRNGLLESAAEILRAAVAGHPLIEGLPADQVNLVSAVWLAELTRIGSDPDLSREERTASESWLEAVRRSIPGCFCDQRYLE